MREIPEVEAREGERSRTRLGLLIKRVGPTPIVSHPRGERLPILCSFVLWVKRRRRGRRASLNESMGRPALLIRGAFPIEK